MKLLLINSAEKELTQFIDPIIAILEKEGIACDVLHYAELLKIDKQSYDGFIISGSPQGDDIIESHQAYFSWIKDDYRPVLGICAGHHIIGYMFGATIIRSLERESGIIKVEIKKEHPVFKGLDKRFEARAMHNDAISLPDGFELLASGPACPNEAMMKSDRPWITLQFHPEIMNHSIIVNFIRMVQKTGK